MGGVYRPSQLERTTVYMMVVIVKGGGQWACTLHHRQAGWDDFSIVMECTPENHHRHSVCTLWFESDQE
jgi:hypothetical protein